MRSTANPLEEVAPLLDLLDLDSSGRLINLPREERRRVLARFDRRARKLSLRGALPVPARVYSRLLRLGEEDLEPRGQFAEAAVLYALAQDDCLERDDDFAGLRILFRFKLGHVLYLLDETGERRCLAFALRTISGLKELKGAKKIPKSAFRPLMYKLQNWLAWRYRELGEQRLAIDAYLGAWPEADKPDERVNCLLGVARLYEELGEDQKAYQWLQQDRDDLKEVDEETREAWETAFGALQLKLGGSLTSLANSLKTPWAKGVAEVMGRTLAQDELLDAGKVFSLYDLLPLPDDPRDADLRHAFLLQRANVAFATGEADRARAMLEEAEQLEARLPGELFALRREVVLAHWDSSSGHPEEAVRRFASIHLRAEVCLEPAERLDILGYSLEALGKSRSSELTTIQEQAGQVLLLFEELLEGQLGSAARRRVRDMNQRALESALFALVEAVLRLPLLSDRHQPALQQAWALIMASRNPELRTVSRDFDNKWAVYRLVELENDFHAALRSQLEADPAERPACWAQPLDRLQEYEISVVQASRPRVSASFPPPGRGIALAFFQFRDLFRKRPMLVLISRKGHLNFRLVPPEEIGTNGDGVPLWPWLPDLLVEDTLAAEADPPSWFFFPDGELHTAHFEMLALSEEPKVRLGERAPVRLCLRPSVPERDEPVDLARGWIGVGGGAPECLGMVYLGAAVQEVLDLRDALTRRGVATRVLLDEEATEERLTAYLAELRPAVLHFAVHGHYDKNFPDACALILAPDPASPCNELLPFRRILDLPLQGVDLVILSACSSLLGVSGRSAGMEGLAWAFLQAGAKQVIASRDDANDEATRWIMTTLYRHLLEHPVAEALRRTRQDYLQEPDVDPRHIALWSVWS